MGCSSVECCVIKANSIETLWSGTGGGDSLVVTAVGVHIIWAWVHGLMRLWKGILVDVSVFFSTTYIALYYTYATSYAIIAYSYIYMVTSSVHSIWWRAANIPST